MIATLLATFLVPAPQDAPEVRFGAHPAFVASSPLPAPPDLPATEAGFELGERLFQDTLLSANRDMSCATCHLPARGFAEPLPRALGNPELRNTPTLYNRVLGATFSWDGKAATLEEQVLMPIENPLEMALPVTDAVARLQGDDGYVEAFEAVFSAGPTRHTLALALSAYVRQITLADSPVDRFFAAQPNSLTREEKAGLWIYESKGRCWKCHVQPNFADERFHNTGVELADGRSADPGRLAFSGDERDRGAFKTPTLRGLVFTAPYMHDGSLETLEEVVEFYRRGGGPNPALDPDLEPLDLTDDDARHLVAFLRALSRVEAAPPTSGPKR